MHLPLMILHLCLKIDLSYHLSLYLNNIFFNSLLTFFNIHDFLATLTKCLLYFSGYKSEIKDLLIGIADLLFNLIEPCVMSVLQTRDLPDNLLVLLILELSQIDIALCQF